MTSPINPGCKSTFSGYHISFFFFWWVKWKLDCTRPYQRFSYFARCRRVQSYAHSSKVNTAIEMPCKYSPASPTCHSLSPRRPPSTPPSLVKTAHSVVDSLQSAGPFSQHPLLTQQGSGRWRQRTRSDRASVSITGVGGSGDGGSGRNAAPRQWFEVAYITAFSEWILDGRLGRIPIFLFFFEWCAQCLRATWQLSVKLTTFLTRGLRSNGKTKHNESYLTCITRIDVAHHRWSDSLCCCFYFILPWN